MIEDPVMLFSYINTKLRDEFDSFSSLCEELELDKERVEKTLAEAGYHYDKLKNQFV